MNMQKLNHRQAQWTLYLYLSRFDFTLKHVLGIKMGKEEWVQELVVEGPDQK